MMCCVMPVTKRFSLIGDIAPIVAILEKKGEYIEG